MARTGLPHHHGATRHRGGRRVIPVNMDARVEDPENRSFRRPGNALRDWVLDSRPALVSAGLTLAILVLPIVIITGLL